MPCISVTWLKTVGEQNRPWVLDNLIYEGVKLERGERLDKAGLNIHTPLSPTLTPIFLFAPLQLSSQKKNFR
jgi:hypothetical protein